MKIPVKIYDTISSALTLQDEENFLRYTDKRKRRAEEKKIENAFKWLKKYKRKQKNKLIFDHTSKKVGEGV